jgi:hypothetical protein
MRCQVVQKQKTTKKNEREEEEDRAEEEHTKDKKAAEKKEASDSATATLPTCTRVAVCVPRLATPCCTPWSVKSDAIADKTAPGSVRKQSDRQAGETHEVTHAHTHTHTHTHTHKTEKKKTTTHRDKVCMRVNACA